MLGSKNQLLSCPCLPSVSRSPQGQQRKGQEQHRDDGHAPRCALWEMAHGRLAPGWADPSTQDDFTTIYVSREDRLYISQTSLWKFTTFHIVYPKSETKISFLGTTVSFMNSHFLLKLLGSMRWLQSCCERTTASPNMLHDTKSVTCFALWNYNANHGSCFIFTLTQIQNKNTKQQQTTFKTRKKDYC